MTNIKKFIDRVAIADGKQAREVSMLLSDAKALRDEIMKLIIDNNQKTSTEVVEVVMQGGKFK
jgi:hypothetical protein